jgi:hypothetical protein
MWVAILVSKDMMELLSLISVGKEFQMPRMPREVLQYIAGLGVA